MVLKTSVQSKRNFQTTQNITKTLYVIRHAAVKKEIRVQVYPISAEKKLKDKKLRLFRIISIYADNKTGESNSSE